MKVERVPIGQVVCDDAFQSRVKLDDDHIIGFRDWLEENPDEDLDPVEAVKLSPAEAAKFDGQFLCTDGFHRRQGYGLSDRTTMLVAWVPGTAREAKLRAAGANGKHGKARTDADLKKAVKMLLADQEWKEMSKRSLANHIHVTESKLRRLFQEMFPIAPVRRNGESSQPERVKRADGSTMKNPQHTKDTLRIAPEPEEAEERDDESRAESVDSAREIMEEMDDWIRRAGRAFSPWRNAREPIESIKDAATRLGRILPNKAS